MTSVDAVTGLAVSVAVAVGYATIKVTVCPVVMVRVNVHSIDHIGFSNTR